MRKFWARPRLLAQTVALQQAMKVPAGNPCSPGSSRNGVMFVKKSLQVVWTVMRGRFGQAKIVPCTGTHHVKQVMLVQAVPLPMYHSTTIGGRS